MTNAAKTLLMLIFIFVSINAQTEKESITYLKSNLEFLASDELEGREATTRGEKVASLFIAQELQKYGVKPFGDEGTYFQNFNMAVGSVAKSSIVTITGNSGEITGFTFKDDFLFASTPWYPDNSFTGKEYEMVFAGYGIISNEDDYNDYKNLDVAGKIVVALNGSPLESQSHLRFRKMREFKTNIADSLGAAGLIVVVKEESYGYWSLLQRYFTDKNYDLEYEVKEKKAIPLIYFSKNALIRILEKEKYNYEKMNEFMNKNKKPESFVLNQKIRLDFTTDYEIKPARNVIGILEGSNTKLKNEYVTIGGHYDHEGIKKGEVYNGADDNGSGIVTILEVARLLADRKDNERSILFIFHTAEEKGLEGAQYLANHAEYIDDVVVHVNIDMVGREDENQLHNIGSGRLSTEFYEIVKEANEESVNFEFDYKYDNPKDPNDFYNRSDHVHYANKGIPIVFFFDDMRPDYHKPTDTVEKINFNKIYKVTKLVEEIALKVANLDHRLKVDLLTNKN